MSYNADPKLVERFDPEFYTLASNLFKKYDKNGDGMIQKYEFRSLIKQVGLDYELKDIKLLFQGIDSNNDSVITFIEFLHLLLGVMPEDKKKK